jgi:hypothetical protein
MSELEKLKKKYKKLKWKEEEEIEKKRLKKEIWRIEHKGIRKVAGVIENIGKGILKTAKSIGNGIVSAGKNYEVSNNVKAEAKPKQSVKEMMDILP